MDYQEKLFDYLNGELDELVELLAYEDNIRGIVASRVRFVIEDELSAKKLQDFAQDLENANIYLLDTGIINPTHVRISLLMVSIATTIQITYLARGKDH